MSLSCGVECIFVFGCARWLWKRCTYIGSYDSATWPSATAVEFESVPRVCRLILAIYEPDLHNPQNYIPANGYRLNPDWVIKRVTYEQTQGHAPPYIIYVDHDHREIVMAVRGLNLAKESDYKTLLDNKLGQQMFDGGYVHHGLLKSAVWLLNRESETLKSLWIENGSDYGMVFAGHSLGSGVVSLLSILVVNHRERLGGISKEKIRCYAIAPARCMSLNLAVKYANVIHSIILQDDFLPRTATPLEDIFKSIFWDTFIPEDRKLRDPRRLYAPGRICGRFPPEVRTAIPVDGRFEHIVLSCNTTADHAIIWIEREAEKALQLMKDQESSKTVTVAPTIQKFERLKTLEKEHKDALERAVSLNVPHAVDSAEEEPLENNGEGSGINGDKEASSSTETKPSGGRLNWEEVVEKLLKKNETGEKHIEDDTNVSH
ncbi:hypothetical protein TSUD_122980 [Trifolium subterraneum]|uniref:Fungal lipase-like domain-containing protein n=1 Tax=Trifolium subterraneum TaxID=3900 RepID=A0A2Z6MA89_TRISU|nr:hypothetical protein TSUD_122980 [Trifolium subterraneum]